MNTFAMTLSAHEPRANFSDILGQAFYGGEHVEVTKGGRLTAIVIGVGGPLALEELEDARNLMAFRKAVRNNDEQCVNLADLYTELGV